jgi:hypothetical protein
VEHKITRLHEIGETMIRGLSRPVTCGGGAPPHSSRRRGADFGGGVRIFPAAAARRLGLLDPCMFNFVQA